MPPQQNATLTAIADGPRVDNWDAPAAAGAAKWSGSAPAYYQEKRERVRSGDATELILRRTLIVDDGVADLVDNNDVLTFLYCDVEQTARVQLIERRRAPGIPAQIATTRLTLEPA